MMNLVTDTARKHCIGVKQERGRGSSTCHQRNRKLSLPSLVTVIVA